MIELERVSYAYPGRMSALAEVSFRLPPGTRAAVIGRNGSGKSTLVKLLCAALYPSAGELRVGGVPVREETRWEVRRNVAVVFQDPDDQLVMGTVRDDVAFGPENLGLPREEIAARVEWALEAMGVSSDAAAAIEDLSPGRKQRVAIAGALAMRPDLLVLDEPTTFLPGPASRRLLRTLRDLNRREGVGVLHITHEMAEAALFDRVLVLDGGRLAMEGTPAEVFRRGEQLRALGLDVPLAARLAVRLRARGVELPGDVLSSADLRAAVESSLSPAVRL